MVIFTMNGSSDNNNQTTITPARLEQKKNGIPILCAPMGEFLDKNNKLIKYPNRIKVGNGFKTIADFRSQEQLDALIDIVKRPKVQKWIRDNLPESTSDPESEVDEQD